MFKFIQVVLVLAVAAICCAEPARLRNSSQSRFSASQDISESVQSQTPYPPAGIIPEIRFELPTEESALEPENTYLPPDNVDRIPAKTYGPPYVSDDTEDVAEEEVETEQPEEAEDAKGAQEQDPLNDEGEDNEIEDTQSERLVLRRSSNLKVAKLQAHPSIQLRSQRLVAQPAERLIAQPIYFSNGRFFTYSPQFLRV